MVISILHFEIKSEKKYIETIYTGNLIWGLIQGILHWESWIRDPNIFYHPYGKEWESINLKEEKTRKGVILLHKVTD